MKATLKSLADAVSGEIKGDPETIITGIANLADAHEGQISFLNNAKFRSHLTATNASAVILSQDDLYACPTNAIIVENPYVSYALIATVLTQEAQVKRGVHQTATVSDTAQIDKSAFIGPNVVIEDDVVIAENVVINANCFIGKHSVIAAGGRILANVSIYANTEIGENVLIHCGAVIGSDGFGFANDKGVWTKIPQIGKVILGDNVEIGANSAIDRGAIDNTIIHDGVKIDNLVHIAHNVEIGEHTAIAACVGIAGSSKIGAYCTIGGGAGINGHIVIADNTHFSGMAMVTKSIKEAGVYASGIPAEPAQQWRKNVVRFRQTNKLEERVKSLEKELDELKGL